MNINEIESIIESMLFAWGDVLPLQKIAEAVEIDEKTTKSIIENMIVNYKNSGRGVLIRQINNGYQLYTNPENYEYVKRIFEPKQKQGLSQAAFETLAIIAYRQPITKARIEQIRGVNSDSAISRLLEKNLIKEDGRLNAPGKPILYATTDEFLRVFGFKSLADLPILDIKDIQEAEESIAAATEE